MEYHLELDRAIARIKEDNAKTVLLQLPDGLKPKAKEIQDTMQKDTDAQIYIWLGSNFGACDIPIVGHIDLLIAFGHSEWR